jgi:glycosyltransferase involved in cell wall biosynthesis
LIDTRPVLRLSSRWHRYAADPGAAQADDAVWLGSPPTGATGQHVATDLDLHLSLDAQRRGYDAAEACLAGLRRSEQQADPAFADFAVHPLARHFQVAAMAIQRMDEAATGPLPEFRAQVAFRDSAALRLLNGVFRVEKRGPLPPMKLAAVSGVPKLFRATAQRPRLRRRPHGPVVLFDASGNSLNRKAALRVARALEEAGQATTVISPEGIRAGADGGSAPLAIPAGDLLPALRLAASLIALGLEQLQRVGRETTDPMRRLGAFLARQHFAGIVNKYVLFRSSLQPLIPDAGVIVTVGERTPINLAATSVARAAGVPVLGVTAVLHGARPEGRYWPADWHAVYGAQARDLLLAAGVPEGRIRITGSPHFDRDPATKDDRTAEFLASLEPDRPLVLVATEARPDQMRELVPLLGHLVERPELCVVVKLHPDDGTDVFERLSSLTEQAPHVRIARHGEVAIEGLFERADVVVAQRSNVLLQAAFAGVPVISPNFSGMPDPVIDLPSEGVALPATDVKEFAAALGRAIDCRSGATDPSAIARFGGDIQDSAARIAALARDIGLDRAG